MRTLLISQRLLQYMSTFARQRAGRCFSTHEGEQASFCARSFGHDAKHFNTFVLRSLAAESCTIRADCVQSAYRREFAASRSQRGSHLHHAQDAMLLQTQRTSNFSQAWNGLRRGYSSKCAEVAPDAESQYPSWLLRSTFVCSIAISVYMNSYGLYGSVASAVWQ
jgi:hypothetical protein